MFCIAPGSAITNKVIKPYSYGVIDLARKIFASIPHTRIDIREKR